MPIVLNPAYGALFGRPIYLRSDQTFLRDFGDETSHQMKTAAVSRRLLRTLLFAVLLSVGFTGVFRMSSRMRSVSTCGMRVMSCLFVISLIVMFSRLAMVASSMGVMFGGLPVVLRSFFRHVASPGRAYNGLL